MNSKQIFMIVTIVAALSAAMIATPVMAQNMTGGNVTSGNMTGGNMTGKISSTYIEGTGCPVSAEGIPDESCLQDKPQGESQDEGQGEEDEEEQEGGN
jgi:hypothetical protein